MKYFSEILDKKFDTEADLIEAEKQHADKETAVANKKKQLSKKIEDADAKLTDALANYEKAKDDVRKIYEEAEFEAKEIMEPAHKAVEKAKLEKYTAVSEFTKNFGKYSAIYTGEKALEEFKRTTDYINSVLKSFNIFGR